MRNGNHPLRYRALACDGDGTLTRGGHMAAQTARALARLRDSGRKVILVTGETVKDVAKFPHLDLFDRVVAENGAVLLSPKSMKERVLCKPPPPALVRALKRRDADPLKIGRVAIETKVPYDRDASDVLGQLQLDWRLIRNRKDVVLLPRGTDKGTGLWAALRDLGLTPREVVAIGDAENDQALLTCAGLGVAVANAVLPLKGIADFVTRGGVGKGVVEVIEWMLADHIDQTERRTLR